MATHKILHRLVRVKIQDHHYVPLNVYQNVSMFTELKWESCDACAITVPANLSYCKQHGVYKLDDKV